MSQEPRVYLSPKIAIAIFLLAAFGGAALQTLAERAGLLNTPAYFEKTFPIVIAVLAAAILARASGLTWRDIGLGRSERFADSVAWAIATVVVVTFALSEFAPFIMEKFQLAPPSFARFEPLYQNLPVAIATLIYVWLLQSFAEEAVFRGFLLNRISALLGGGDASIWIGAIGQGVLFGLFHFHQGPTLVVMTGLVGVLFGLIYVSNRRRSLWPIILAHGYLNTLDVIRFYGVDASRLAGG